MDQSGMHTAKFVRGDGRYDAVEPTNTGIDRAYPILASR